MRPLTPVEHDFVLTDFQFHIGERMPALRIRCTTIGDPDGEPVLLLHGTTASSRILLGPAFAGELFGPGQPLDARRYYLILPDAIGAGASSKPSDGLRMKFPRYNYADMVQAQHRVLREKLGVDRLRMVMGNSMGGMHAWMWSQQFPNDMDIVVPMAALPTPISGRNLMMRRLLTQAIRTDPDWLDGNYAQQPRGWRMASLLFNTATNGGTLGLQHKVPTIEAADALIQQQMADWAPSDANDHLYQWDASRDYDASQHLETIRATVLAILANDDERNPAELGVMEAQLRRVPRGSLLRIPASADTAGHGTTGHAKWYAHMLARLLENAPRLTGGNPPPLPAGTALCECARGTCAATCASERRRLP